MRHFGRLKSFSSRQRQAQPLPAAAAAPAKSRGGRRWGHRAAHAAEQPTQLQVPPPPPPPAPPATPPAAARTPHRPVDDDDGDDETKESAETQLQQIQQTRPLQRAQCVRLTCAAPPDLVLPYLYGDRKSRINAIMLDTACTIDYCPMSPGDEPQSPQSRAYILNFLVSGESAASLEEATRMLRALVEKVEAHLHKKMRIRSLHAMAHRAMGGERHSVQDSGEGPNAAGAAAATAAAYAGGFAAPEATRMEREREPYAAAGRPHRALSPAAAPLETPLDRYRLSHASGRPDDDFARREYQARMAAMQAESEYLDRWGRPVFRHVQESQGSDVDGDVAGSQAPRSAHRRRYPHYADAPAWGEPPREFVRVPVAPGDDRDAPASRRYAVFRATDAYAEFEFEGVHFGPPFAAEERYADYETEDLLEREEDLLAAQEYAIAARVQSAYAARREARRHAAYYRESSPPRYVEQRAARSGSISRYPPRYFDDHDGEWLTDDDERGVLYRRYPRYPPAMPYPRMYMGGSSSSAAARPRSSSFPDPGRHLRPVPPESPVAGGGRKRRKTSGVSYDGEYMRTDHDRDAQAAAAPMPPFAAERHAESHARGYRDEQPMNGVASIEVPLSDESSPSSSPGGADRGELALVYERESRSDAIDSRGANETTPQQVEDTEEAGGAKSELEADEPMDECSDGAAAAGAAADQLEDVDAVVIADAVSAEDASDATSHDAIGEELHSDSAACGSAATSDNDHAGDVVMRAAPEPSPSLEPEDADLTPEQQPTPAPALDTVPRRSNGRMRANESLIAALRRDSAAEGARLETQREAASQRAKCLALEERSKRLAQLDALVAAVYDLQCRVVSSSCALDVAARREMLDVLDAAMQASARPETSTAEKLAVLRTGLERALSRCDLEHFVRSTASPRPAAAAAVEEEEEEEQPAPQSRSRSPVTSTDGDPALDDDPSDTDSGWLDAQCSAELLSRPPQEATAAAPTHSSSPKRGRSLVQLKPRDESALEPSATSSYAARLFLEVASCSPSSFVMKGMQQRLLDEIERADAYYYLLPVTPLAAHRVRPPAAACDFSGGGSASSPAWVPKVIAQISSRMKWFDEVTYALARARSGGPDASADRLNRKKMNSTIRKLHLMAIQLHCVVAHLYGLRGRAACRASDAVPAALNSSYFEKRMIAYKARLKLDADLHGTPDELLRDTFEFFPELLFCLEMWGYDYREGLASSGGGGGASKLRVGRRALPLALFARVEARVLDYEADANGFLQTVCEELLTIVCLWNDFVWGDNLATLPVDRIAAFEAEIKTSTTKILHTYALHLVGAWAVRLLANPDELRGLRFTQQNAYYAERRGAAAPTVKVTSGDDDERARVAAYWQQQRAAPEATAAPTMLRVDAIERWSKEAVATYLLPWSRVFELRCELETRGVVVSDFLRRVGDRSAKTDAPELRGLLDQARVVGTDAAAVCELLALHFASSQLRQEPRAAPESEPLPEAPPEPPASSNSSNNSNSSSSGGGAAAPAPPAAEGLDRQDVKDLMQILTSTRKEAAEIFCARTRSGRVRDKLQVQAVQLAQQSLDLLQTIASRRAE